jgi:hypothetical protein
MLMILFRVVGGIVARETVMLGQGKTAKITVTIVKMIVATIPGTRTSP